MSFVPSNHQDAIDSITYVLTCAERESRVSVIGSLGQHVGDDFSDLDLRWQLPLVRAPGLLRSLRSTLENVAPVESLRWDPDHLSRSDGRLAFVRFADWPLFWRVDLEIVVPNGELPRGTALDGDEWSPAESALLNLVAVVKAIRRDRPDDAAGLYTRAAARAGVAPTDGTWSSRVEDLARKIAGAHPEQRDLATRVRDLAQALPAEH